MTKKANEPMAKKANESMTKKVKDYDYKGLWSVGQ